jgi:hypothetical protein
MGSNFNDVMQILSWSIFRSLWVNVTSDGRSKVHLPIISKMKIQPLIISTSDSRRRDRPGIAVVRQPPAAHFKDRYGALALLGGQTGQAGAPQTRCAQTSVAANPPERLSGPINSDSVTRERPGRVWETKAR